jgi:hypothetical protein
MRMQTKSLWAASYADLLTFYSPERAPQQHRWDGLKNEQPAPARQPTHALQEATMSGLSSRQQQRCGLTLSLALWLAGWQRVGRAVGSN